MIPEAPLCFTNPAGDVAVTEQNAGRRCELHQELIAANLRYFSARHSHVLRGSNKLGRAASYVFLDQGSRNQQVTIPKSQSANPEQ